MGDLLKDVLGSYAPLAPIFSVAFFMLILAGFLKAIADAKGGGPKAYTDKTLNGYQLVKSINNKSESEMVEALTKRFGHRFRICPKVRMEDVISVRRNAGDFKQRQSLRGRVKSRHFDCIMTTPFGKPVAAVEFDGPTHKRRNERRTDAFKDELCRAVGLPMLRIDYREPIHVQVDRISL